MKKTLNGAVVNYVDDGEGLPTLLLHGWGGRIDSWAPVRRALLAQGRRVVIVDFPGHGESSDPPQPWNVEEYAKATAQLIEELGIAGCDVISHSFGGRVTLVLAAERPELVGRVVLAGAAGLKMPLTFKRKLRKALVSAAKAVLSLLGKKRAAVMREKLAVAMGSADYKACSPYMRNTFVKIIEQDARPLLGKIKAPALLIYGRNDTETPVTFGEIMEKEIPNAGLVVLEGTGHYAYLDQFQQFMRIVSVFLNREEKNV